MSARLEITAARELGDSRFAAAVAALPDALVGMLPLVPGASATIVMGSATRGGVGVLAVELEGPDARLTDAFARELAAELDAAFAVRVSRRPRRSAQREWIVRPATVRAAGFGDHGGAWLPAADQGERYRSAAVRWLALSAQYPGLQWRLSVSMDASAPESRDTVLRASVAHRGASLPLRARALVERLLPGASVDDEPAGAPACFALSRDDARSLLQLPMAHNAPLPGIAAAPARPRAAQPTAMPAARDGLRIGSSVLPNGLLAEVRIGAEERQRHTHVIGKTGTGKSTLLAGMMHELALAGKGFLLLDPHGDLAGRVLAELPESARDRVWFIDAGDVQNPTPMNPIAEQDPVLLDIIIQDLVLMFYSLFDPKHTGIVGPRFESLFTHSVRGLLDLRGPRASLLDVPRVFRDRKIERAIARAVTDPQAIEFWRGEMSDMGSSTRGEIIGWFTSKFDRFANTQAMRGILGTGADAFDPAAAMDEGRIVIVDLSKQKLGEVASNLLGFLYLTRFWTGLAKRTTRTTFDFFVDEVHSFSAGSLPSMLSEGRKWGACVTVAHQYLAQLDERLSEALSGNVATTIAFRTGPQDAAQLSQRAGGELAIADLTTQGDLQALITRTSGVALPLPHTLLVDHNSRVTARAGDELEAFVADIRARSHRALVDPFRHLSPFDPLVEEQRPPAAPAPDGGQSFLDEWLEKRRYAAATADGAS